MANPNTLGEEEGGGINSDGIREEDGRDRSWCDIWIMLAWSGTDVAPNKKFIKRVNYNRFFIYVKLALFENKLHLS